jgi:hypothetical protein
LKRTALIAADRLIVATTIIESGILASSMKLVAGETVDARLKRGRVPAR